MKEEIALLTATGDREVAFELCIKWMSEQDYQGDIHWIIVDDGFTKATENVLDRTVFDKRFRVSILKRAQGSDEAGPRSMAQNILVGCSEIKEEKILIIEDDDYYHPFYIRDMVNRLTEHELTGTIWQNYYYLPDMTYRTYKNRGSALCSTGFRRNLIFLLQASAHRSFKKNLKGLDAYFWERAIESGYEYEIFDNTKKHLMIGMKGLPGRRGIGIGHHKRQHSKWMSDPAGEVLHLWVGDTAAELYIKIKKEHNL